MDLASLSDAANLATVIGVTAALLTAIVVFRDWHHKTRHRLYISAPNYYSQNPEDPEFWVFPPKEMEDGSFALVIAGKVINAGPSDAFSVRIFSETEDESTDFVGAIDAAVEKAVGIQEYDSEGSKGHRAVENAFFESFKTRNSLIPVLPASGAQRFVLVARLEPGDEYLKALLKEDMTAECTMPWEVDGKQMHGIHARSRTALGRQLSFGPADLTAPFEKGRWYDALKRRRKLDREP